MDAAGNSGTSWMPGVGVAEGLPFGQPVCSADGMEAVGNAPICELPGCEVGLGPPSREAGNKEHADASRLASTRNVSALAKAPQR